MKSRPEVILLILFSLMLIILFSKFEKLRSSDNQILSNQAEFRKMYVVIQKTLKEALWIGEN